jgi:molecular chaperone DnaJ
MKQDYYDVLGVSRDASADEIRRTYRQLARQHHPDVNHGDPEADARFKSINEAYEVLKDPDKRSAYDRFGHAGVGGGAQANGVYTDFPDIGEIFEQFFGLGGRGRTRSGRPAPERGADLRLRLRLTFEEAVFGVTRTVEVTRREVCDTCRGTGAAPGSQAVACVSCAGTGQMRRVQQSVFGSFVNVQTCPACSGRGEVMPERCPTCVGAGRAARRRTLEVDMPAGVEDGLQIRLAGEGEHGRWGGSPGDLYVALEVASHPVFERHGNDVLLTLRVNPADAALGAQVTVPTLEGTATLHVPAGTQSGDTFRLEKQGVPYLKRNGRGDQVVRVVVTTPQKLNREQRHLLEQLRASLTSPEVVERDKGGFWDKVKEKLS